MTSYTNKVKQAPVEHKVRIPSSDPGQIADCLIWCANNMYIPIIFKFLFSLKPLGQFLVRRWGGGGGGGGEKIIKKCLGHTTKMVIIPINGKNLQNFLLNQKSDDLENCH